MCQRVSQARIEEKFECASHILGTGACACTHTHGQHAQDAQHEHAHGRGQGRRTDEGEVNVVHNLPLPLQRFLPLLLHVDAACNVRAHAEGAVTGYGV